MTPPASTSESLKVSFQRLVTRLYETGYLDKEIPQPCVDDRNRGVDPASVLEEHLGVPDLWPLDTRRWSDELFYSLIEVFHDLVARPQHRTWHSWDECGWHYSNYAIEPARRLYRWQVNRLLDRSVVPYRLAEAGDDEGRLVARVDDARSELLAVMTQREDPGSAGKVRHAIALFRARGASVEECHSAARVLADVLEERRGLLKEALVSKDEGALFQIANGFAIRHNRAGQQGDYDPAFLNWVFWWYLATIELTDRLLDRQAS